MAKENCPQFRLPCAILEASFIKATCRHPAKFILQLSQKAKHLRAQEKYSLVLLNQDVPHGLDVLVAIIRGICSLVSTSVGVIVESASTKPDSGVTGCAVAIVTKETNSCSGMNIITQR